MRPRLDNRRWAARAPEILAELLGVDAADLHVLQDNTIRADPIGTPSATFVIEPSKSSSVGPVAAAARRARERATRMRGHPVPLVAVPFMGEVGRGACEEAGVGWLDLSGNARIIAPGMRVIIEGKPNLFKAAGRPPNLFAPKGSRIARWLLINSGERFTQREIARATDLDEGFVSRLVTRLEEEEYLARDEEGRVHAKDPAVLLEAWRAAYKFDRHTIHAGHVAVRSGEALLLDVNDTLAESGIEHAATGLAAAWVLTRFAGFRVATLYLSSDPSPKLLERLGFREDERGANLWLVIPNDAGVFQGTVEKDGLRCVHPVQVFVDLKGHHERAAEAAERLRKELLTWRKHG